MMYTQTELGDRHLIRFLINIIQKLDQNYCGSSLYERAVRSIEQHLMLK